VALANGRDVRTAIAVVVNPIDDPDERMAAPATHGVHTAVEVSVNRLASTGSHLPVATMGFCQARQESQSGDESENENDHPLHGNLPKNQLGSNYQKTKNRARARFFA